MTIENSDKRLGDKTQSLFSKTFFNFFNFFQKKKIFL